MNGVGLGLSGCSVQEIFTQAEQGARFHLEGTVNTLLHSFATHLLEKGGICAISRIYWGVSVQNH
jgi:site-specific recombinase XerD